MSIKNYRAFGRTGLKIFPISLGCMTFGDSVDRAGADRIVGRAIDAGINLLDTANVYAHGRGEEVLGEVLQGRGDRDAIILATKFSFTVDDGNVNAEGNSRRHIVKACEDSLRRLKTDYIDLYQIHRPVADTPIDETLRALDDLIRAGKVRYVGTSNFSAWQIVESLWASKELGLNRVVSEQSPYNILDRRLEREVLPATRSYGMAVMPWGPIAGGMLTGKYKRDEALPADSRFARPIALKHTASQDAGEQKIHPIYAKRMADTAFDALEKLDLLVKERGMLLSQFALAWNVRQPGITSALVGPRTVEQLDDALQALDLDLTDDDLRAVDAIVPPGTHASSFYELKTEPSQHRWM